MRKGMLLKALALLAALTLLAAPALAQSQSQKEKVDVVFDGKSYENVIEFTWETEIPVPEGGIVWDGTEEFLEMDDFLESDLIQTPNGDPHGEVYVKNQIAFMSVERNSFYQIQQIAAKYGFKVVGYLAPTADYVIESVEEKDYDELQKVIEELKKESSIVPSTVVLRYPYQQVEQAYPSDPWGGADWNENEPDGYNWNVEAIKAPTAWNYLSYMKEMNVGVIDVAFLGSHPDLNYYAVFDRTDLSTVHDSIGSFWIFDDEDRKTMAQLIHATHVSGTFAAVQNAEGLTGVYPKGRIVGIGIGYQNRDQTIADNIKEAIGRLFNYTDSHLEKYYFLNMRYNNVHVINMSLGFDHKREEINNLANAEQSLLYARERTRIYTEDYGWGIFFERLDKWLNYDFVLIQAAGNDRINAENGYWPMYVDNKYLKDRLIVVGSYKKAEQNGFAFSNYNYGNAVNVIAPGERIYSTIITEHGDYSYGDESFKYFFFEPVQIWSGTSMAAPHVAGTAAMIWSLDPEHMTGPKVKQFILENANYDQALTSGHSDDTIYNQTTGGRSPRYYPLLNAGAAVKAAYESIYGPSPTATPTVAPDETPEPAETATPEPTPEPTPDTRERGTLNVKVTCDGVPVAGASVTLSFKGTVEASGTTDENGVATIVAPTQDYDVEVEKEGYGWFSRKASAFPGIESTIEIELSRELPASYFTYEIIDDAYVSITGYIGPADVDLVIPSYIAGLPVKSIGGFENRYDIKGRIVIPNTVETIREFAFSNSREWMQFTGDLIIPPSVTSIGRGAFRHCAYLDGQLALSENLEEIPENAFAYCYALGGELIIPEKVRRIGSGAFNGPHLKRVIIEGNIEYAGSDAFNLTSNVYEIRGEVTEDVLDSIFDGVDFVNYDLLLIGRKGSIVEEYAKKNGVRFQPLEE